MNEYGKKVSFDGQNWYYNFGRQLVREDELRIAMACIDGVKAEEAGKCQKPKQ